MGDSAHGESGAQGGAEEDHLSADAQGIRRLRRRVSLVLDGGSLALFVIFIAQLIPTLLLINPASNAWQDQFADVLIKEGALAFLGFVMIHLACLLQPNLFGLRRRLSLVRRLAVLAVLGYILLVPMQLTSAFATSMANRAKRTNYLQQITRLSEVRESIQRATNLRDLDLRLQSLFEPALTPQQSSMGLVELRRTLLRVNQERQLENTRLMKELSINQDFVGPMLSRCVSAMGWALAFATGAVPFGMRSSLFERMVKR
ncbi:MAG: hypothetical protein ACK5QW_09595 [Cyanobacteriota bacterium]